MQIISGQLKKPIACTITGVGGIGKTTFCAKAPNPIFVPTEEVDEISCARFPTAKSYKELVANLDYLVTQKHDYKSIIIDSLDQAEMLLHQYLLENEPKGIKTQAMAYGGYGAFWVEATKRMNEDIKSKLIKLRDEKGMHVFITTHCHKKTETDPILGATYESYSMNVHKGINSLFFDWVSCALFCTFVVHKIQDDNSDKTFVTGDGERTMFTSKRAGFSAKNRYNLPSEMPMDFDEFYRLYEDFYAGKKRSPDQIRTNILTILTNVSDEKLKSAVNDAVEKSGDNVEKLESVEARLKIRVGD